MFVPAHRHLDIHSAQGQDRTSKMRKMVRSQHSVPLFKRRATVQAGNRRNVPRQARAINPAQVQQPPTTQIGRPNGRTHKRSGTQLYSAAHKQPPGLIPATHRRRPAGREGPRKGKDSNKQDRRGSSQARDKATSRAHGPKGSGPCRASH